MTFTSRKWNIYARYFLKGLFDISERAAENPIVIRNPGIEDGSRIWSLACLSKPLDLNSPYFYLLFCRHFSRTCLIAEKNSHLLGFVLAYRPPQAESVIFVWQIAVLPDARKQGLGRTLLRELLRRAGSGARYIEATVTPSNQASRSLFLSLASELETACEERPFLGRNIFPEEERHEEEILLSLGPLPR
ncbi:MAG: diaminobutyrate acetyltransferase [Thermoleophilia bacterium]|nr:diaminobutyrate acetyltransferase [Thermoleophilia bacterium]